MADVHEHLLDDVLNELSGGPPPAATRASTPPTTPVAPPPSAPATSAPSAPSWFYEQDAETLTLHFQVPAGVRGKDCEITAKEKLLRVVVAGQTLADWTLHGAVAEPAADEGLWQLEDGATGKQLQVTLTKATADRGEWTTVSTGPVEFSSTLFLSDEELDAIRKKEMESGEPNALGQELYGACGEKIQMPSKEPLREDHEGRTPGELWNQFASTGRMPDWETARVLATHHAETTFGRRAIANLASFAKTKKDLDEALMWTLWGHKTGDLQCSLHVGYAHEDGSRLAKSWALAMKIYTHAALQGDMRGVKEAADLFLLGRIGGERRLFSETGPHLDVDRAKALLTLAKSRGSHDAYAYEMERWLEGASGYPKSLTMARKLEEEYTKMAPMSGPQSRVVMKVRMAAAQQPRMALEGPADSGASPAVDQRQLKAKRAAQMRMQGMQQAQPANPSQGAGGPDDGGRAMVEWLERAGRFALYGTLGLWAYRNIWKK